MGVTTASNASAATMAANIKRIETNSNSGKFVAFFNGGVHHATTVECPLRGYATSYVSVSGNTITFKKACTVKEYYTYCNPSYYGRQVGSMSGYRHVNGVSTKYVNPNSSSSAGFLEKTTTLTFAVGDTLKYTVANGDGSNGFASVGVTLVIN